jgi:sugar/nucleoside kinase (ribokinase family)
MSFKNVLCFGSLNPDLVYFIDKLPSLGGDIQSKKYFIRAGGTAINCAENIAMWNINTAVRGNSIGNDELGTFLIKHLDNLEIVHKDVIKDSTTTPTCSIYIDESGERTIISSGYEENNWSNLNNIQDYDSLLIDRYSIKYVKEELKKVKKDNNIFLTQAGYEEEINYELDFLVVSKNEIEVKEANEILEKGLAKWILLTSSNLPARLLSTDGVLEIVPPDFKTINATGAGDATAAYISAFGIKDIVDSVKKACAAGAIVAGTNDKPNLKMIDEISKLVEIHPR